MKNKNELYTESLKKVKRTGNATRKALRAQYVLYQDFIWGDRTFNIIDNGVNDRTMDDIIYEGYDEK